MNKQAQIPRDWQTEMQLDRQNYSKIKRAYVQPEQYGEIFVVITAGDSWGRMSLNCLNISTDELRTTHLGIAFVSEACISSFQYRILR